ncbi:Tol-Pal system beta propeller repeat protein TolB [Roseateles asaccharophilus]|uniref:Tol-Pal system protein TolB n=1 Tax=Roseateles asaccharophilus TaxID=582607 RepID=A0ABU2AGG2_9BURK|nr:Tol-Pal system beta propeller repeat protein TolB [Roseateles asaccharophilus]MDR7336065.1 TolB protein [Roseateles asaccharophilus]
MLVPVSRRRSLAALAAMGASFGAAPVLAQMRIDISGVGSTRVPVSIVDFRDEAKSPQPIAAIIRADLERSGQFRTVDAPAGLSETASPVFTEWRARQTDWLVAGSVNRLADGRLDIRFKLWDVVKGTELVGQAQAVHPDDARLAAHRIADLIYEKVTGEKGVFATRMAYVTKAGRRYSLVVADADGEGAKVALTSAEPIISPAWAPNGRELAYVSFESGKATVRIQDVQTGGRRVLADFKGTNSAPAWSPDGNQLALSLSRDGGTQLFVINRDGSGLRRIAQSSAIDTEACYAPDGSKIYFVSDRGGGPQIYRMPAGGGTAERVTFNGGYNISPAISPDGRTMAYITRASGAFRLSVMDLGTGQSQQISEANDDESPSFAPNGKLIVYASRAGGKEVLMTSTLDGKIKTPLLVTLVEVREPTWGPFVR